ncbi:MAG TPA: twin-arginine translocase TatA/TatE family subunit [Acidimicrobiales bacterium]|nr:twin-arginine translocase TatA/TatE family subunit [Acidimicrobiales bacterium]
MFNVGPAEVLMILVVALLVLGPKKLPEAARQMGKAMTEFRRVTAGLQDEARGVLDEHLDVATPLQPDVLPPAVDPVDSIPPAVEPVEATEPPPAPPIA